jgi:hypothetical protein
VTICDGEDDYRFGFNGQEKVNEVAGKGNHNTAFFGELDTRPARRWNLDPKPVPWESRYAVFRNSPILSSDVLMDYSKFGATWRNFVHGGTGVTKTTSNDGKGTWGYTTSGKDGPVFHFGGGKKRNSGWQFDFKEAGEIKSGSDYAQVQLELGDVGVAWQQGTAETVAEVSVEIKQSLSSTSASYDGSVIFPFDGNTKKVGTLGLTAGPLSVSTETVIETRLKKVTSHYIKEMTNAGGLLGFQSIANYTDVLGKTSFRVRERFVGLDLKIEAGLMLGGSFNLRLGASNTDTTGNQ